MGATMFWISSRSHDSARFSREFLTRLPGTPVALKGNANA